MVLSCVAGPKPTTQDALYYVPLAGAERPKGAKGPSLSLGTERNRRGRADSYVPKGPRCPSGPKGNCFQPFGHILSEGRAIYCASFGPPLTFMSIYYVPLAGAERPGGGAYIAERPPKGRKPKGLRASLSLAVKGDPKLSDIKVRGAEPQYMPPPFGAALLFLFPLCGTKRDALCPATQDAKRPQRGVLLRSPSGTERDVI